MGTIPRRRRANRESTKTQVLFVDDESGVLEALQHMVADSELTPLTAMSGPEALELLAAHGPLALVMSDYRMPGMTGVELLREVHGLYPKTRRLILSGYAEAHAVLEAVNEGHVNHFFPKPWNDQTLLTALREAVADYQLEMKNEQLHRLLEERNQELVRVNELLEQRVRDRTAEMEAQYHALRISHEILDRLPYALFGIDPDLRIVAINDLGRTLSLPGGVPDLGEEACDVFSAEAMALVERVFEKGSADGAMVPVGDRSLWADCVPLGGTRGAVLLFRGIEDG